MNFRCSIIIIAILFNDHHNLKCGVVNPIEELEWLKAIKTAIESSDNKAQIFQFQYKGEYVFLVDACYQCPDALGYVYNCNGEIVCEFGGYLGLNTCPDFNENVTDRKVLFDNTQDK